jgi:hypothetical protein
MDRQIDLRGASGEIYRYRCAEGGDTRTPTGGNFVYVAIEGEAVRVLYAGASPSLTAGAQERWNEALSRHGATHLYFRLNVAGAARERELADLVAGHAPVMNEAATAERR